RHPGAPRAPAAAAIVGEWLAIGVSSAPAKSSKTTVMLASADTAAVPGGPVTGAAITVTGPVTPHSVAVGAKYDEDVMRWVADELVQWNNTFARGLPPA